MRYQFANAHVQTRGQLDAKTRRMVRSRATKDRKIDRQQRPPPSSIPIDGIEPTKALAASVNISESQLRSSAGAPRSFLGDAWETCAPGIIWTPLERLRIKQYFNSVADAFYPHEVCKASDITLSIWFQALATDEAYFHIAQAISSVCVDSFLGCHQVSPLALSHLSRSFAIVTQRLTGDAGVSDSTIAVVAVLFMYETVQSHANRMKAHLDGLQQMVNMRGGISAFAGKPSVLQKLCRRLYPDNFLNDSRRRTCIDCGRNRADIEFCLLTGSPLRFCTEPMLVPVSARLERAKQCSIPFILDCLNIHPDSPLGQITLDVYATVQLFNELSVGQEAKLEPFEYQDIVQSLGYRLLLFEVSSASQRLEPVSKALLAGLTALVVSFLYRFGRRRHSHYNPLADKLKAVVLPLTQVLHAQDNLEFHQQAFTRVPPCLPMWLLLVGAVSIWGEDLDEDFTIPAMSSVSQAAGVQTWYEVQALIRQFPWVPILHDKPAKALWLKTQKATRSKDT